VEGSSIELDWIGIRWVKIDGLVLDSRSSLRVVSIFRLYCVGGLNALCLCECAFMLGWGYIILILSSMGFLIYVSWFKVVTLGHAPGSIGILGKAESALHSSFDCWKKEILNTGMCLVTVPVSRIRGQTHICYFFAKGVTLWWIYFCPPLRWQGVPCLFSCWMRCWWYFASASSIWRTGCLSYDMMLWISRTKLFIIIFLEESWIRV
jgi:hypothetical protein